MRLRHLTMLMLSLMLCVSGTSARAQDGKQLFQTFCAACHGNDGMGPKDNPNPPLAKSEWLLGKPDRAIAAVLHGLTGPIEVKGRLYNIAMPPQGAMLNDEQLAAILTYVRGNFGNKQKPVSAKQVAKVRAKHHSRKVPWNAHQLRQTYPIPFREGWPRIRNLRSTVYTGKFEEMPNFSQLEPAAFEEEPRNLVDVAHAGLEKEFAIIWEGEIVTSREGDYNAVLSSSDGTRLFVNGKKVVEVEGIGLMNNERTRRRRFRMIKGKNPFRLEYFNNQGNPGLVFQMQGPTGAPYLSESRLTLKDSAPPILLTPHNGRTQIYRNFIKGSRPKAIGVGYLGGVNQAFAIPFLGPDQIWRGKFIDAGRHWTNRGQGFQPPAGKDVVQLLTAPAYAILSTEEASWPTSSNNTLATRYLGYDLVTDGSPARHRPVFNYELHRTTVRDDSVPLGNHSLKRTLTFTVSADSLPSGLHLALALGPKIKKLSADTFLIDDKVLLTAPDALIRNVGKPHLVIPIDFSSGTHVLDLIYTWPTP